MKNISIPLLIMLALLISTPVAAKVRAQLDDDSITLGETVSLTIGMEDERLANQIDTSILSKDFDIIWRNTRSNISISNTGRLTETTLVLGLLAKHVGEIIIPAFEVGSLKTEPLTLTVSEKSATSGPVDETPPVLIEAQWMNTGKSYVQSQLNLVVRIYHVGNLLSAALGEPQMENTLVRRLGEDMHGVKTKNGVEYQTLERHFALFPQKSGALTLPAISMQMRAPVPKDQARRSFGFDVFNQQTVMLKTEPLMIEVLPRHAENQSASWLPAEEATLERSGLPEEEIKIGAVINLQFDLVASGLNAEQLPMVSIPSLDDQFSVYPDEPTLRNTTDGRVVKGSRKQTFVLIPKRSGELTIPEIKLAWWDKIQDQQKQLIVPAVNISIAALASDDASVNSDVDPVLAEIAAQPPLAQAELSEQSSAARFWQWMTAAGFAAWLLTLAYYLFYKPRVRGHLTDDADTVELEHKPELSKIAEAVSNNNPVALWQALQQYGKARWPLAPPTLPLDWAQRLDDQSVTSIMSELEAQLFSGSGSKNWSAKAFGQGVMPLLKKSHDDRRKGADTASAQLIPALYPD